MAHADSQDRHATQALGPYKPGIRFRLRASGVESIARVGLWLLGSVATEMLGRCGDLAVRDEQRRAERVNARHVVSAERLAAVLGRLKGPFAKAGQFAAVRPDLLPRSLRAPFRALQDRVPPLSPDVIRPWLEQSLGLPLVVAFERFDPVPIGAASIAQVHRARTHDGVEVAVKIQYPWLAPALAGDLRLLGWLLARASRRWGRESFEPERLLAEFERSFREELDFEHEATVAQEIAHNLEADPCIVVPRVISNLSSAHVLTMELHDVVGLDDRAALERLGVAPARLVEILGRAYAKQIFVDGLFHADPHPGNLFVIDEAGAGDHPRILFVDFGLSHRLDPTLRRELRQGLFALMQRKPGELVEQMDRMGMIAPGARPAVEHAVQTMFDHADDAGAGRGVLSASGSQLLGLKDRAIGLLEGTPGLRLPNELLLYAKTLSYLFSLAEQLDSNTDMMKIALPYVLKFLATRD